MAAAKTQCRQAGQTGAGGPASLPIVRRLTFDLGEGERRRLSSLAGWFAAEEPALGTSDAFGDRVSSGLGTGPKLVFEDQHEVGLFHTYGDPPLEYRALMLAGEGDLMLFGGRRDPDFEGYCRDHLGLGRVEVLAPALGPMGRRTRLAERCRRDGVVFDRAVALARRYGGLDILPYMGSGSVWHLAAALAGEAGVPIRVAAPPPRLTQRVNDKLWFARLVRRALGRDALPPSYWAYGPAALAGRVAALGRRHARVVVKVPDSAGAEGNLVLEAADLRGLSLPALKERLLGPLRAVGWRECYPLLVGVWECAVLDSPSVQLWIPHGEAGDPVVEGVFSQVLQGSSGEFAGAVPALLPISWHERLAHEAGRMAVVLQALGYFGRCSFDALLVGETVDGAALHWIECNGRWGGVSVPMSLANRLTGAGGACAFVTLHRAGEGASGQSFAAVLTRLRELLFRPGSDQGVVLLTPDRIVDGTGFDLMAIAADGARARALADRAAARLADSA